MPVTDEQEATLHAQLAGNFEEYKRLLDALDPIAMRTGYSALVSAAFSIAADKRFAAGATAADVIDYVADVRSRAESASRLDPRIAERVLLAIISDERLGDIDARASFEAQLVLLAALTADAQLDGAELDSFMRRARRRADQWLS